MRNNSEGDNGTFWGFVIYAKVQYPEDSSSRGEFMKPLPEGIEMTECTDGYKVWTLRNHRWETEAIQISNNLAVVSDKFFMETENVSYDDKASFSSFS